MQTTKKKPSVIFLVIGAVLSAYFGYLVNGAWEKGMEFMDFLDAMDVVMSNPLRDYYNQNTIKAVVMAVMIFLLVMVMYYTSQRNYMPGKEYGTARLARPKELNKVLCDKDKGKNRILSRNLRMSIDTRLTKLNNNVLIIGGSGAGKTFYEVKPNIMQQNTSFIVTDPKGEILRSEGDMLKKNGYNVKVINLLEMDKSDCYNPFSYIREETDVVKLITNLMSNTTPKGANPTDPFWEKAEGLFLQALFYYVWLVEKPKKRNMATVMKLMAEAEVKEQGKPSALDVRMKLLEETSPLGANHPAVKQYNKCMRGAGDTVRSIIISANSRLATLENKQVLRLLSKDELKLAELGIGVNGDKKTKTALFCVIPDSDKSYNFIIGMLYTQIFQELYYQADFHFGGRLPVHVTFMLDEFANVALPDDYCSLLSTMRSREISSVIIIQNLAQIKALFKDTWETIPGNCDTLIYLGGNEQSTHEYISKLLGKGTIDKKSTGETKGRQGSSSRNYDVLGREIMMPDEVRKLDNRKCLVFIRGFDPVLDEKYSTPEHPLFMQSADGNGSPYECIVRTDDSSMWEKAFEVINNDSLAYYKELRDKGENVYIDSLTCDEFLLLGHGDMEKRFIEMDERRQKQMVDEQMGYELQYMPEDMDMTEDSNVSDDGNAVKEEQQIKKDTGKQAVIKKGNPIPEKTDRKDKGKNPAVELKNRIYKMHFSSEQLAELKRATDEKIPAEYILTYFYPKNSVITMMSYRVKYEREHF